MYRAIWDDYVNMASGQGSKTEYDLSAVKEYQNRDTELYELAHKLQKLKNEN